MYVSRVAPFGPYSLSAACPALAGSLSSDSMDSHPESDPRGLQFFDFWNAAADGSLAPNPTGYHRSDVEGGPGTTDGESDLR